MKFKWDNSIHYNRLESWTLSKTVNGSTSDTKNIIPAVLLGTYNIHNTETSTNYAENTVTLYAKRLEDNTIPPPELYSVTVNYSYAN